jgi:hypothetical protein
LSRKLNQIVYLVILKLDSECGFKMGCAISQRTILLDKYTEYILKISENDVLVDSECGLVNK